MKKPMNREIRDQWVEELESGRFPQGRNVLRSTDDKYCCLGVLCEIAVQAGVIEPPIEATYDAYKYGGWSVGSLPDSVLAWSGLDYREQIKLSDFNDSGYSFDYIAKYIRNNL